MTAKEISEKAASIAYPNLPLEAIQRVGVAIWNASPSGELVHIFELRDMLRTQPELVAEYVKSLRNVESAAAEWKNPPAEL